LQSPVQVGSLPEYIDSVGFRMTSNPTAVSCGSGQRGCNLHHIWPSKNGKNVGVKDGEPVKELHKKHKMIPTQIEAAT